MSDAELSTSANARPKRNPLVMLALVAGGVIVAIVGLMQTMRGLGEMFGFGVPAEVRQLVEESDAAINEANQRTQSAATPFQELLNAIDAQPLDEVRSQHDAAGRQAEQDFAQAAAQFRSAAEKLDEANTHNVVDKLKDYFAEKSKAYKLLAKVCEDNREIIQVVLDDAIEYAQLEARVLEIAARRDAAQQEATEISENADAAVKQP